MNFAFDDSAAAMDVHDPNFVQAQERVGMLVNRVRMHLVAAMEAALLRAEDVGRYELNAAQFFILSALHTGATEHATELCQVLAYDPGTMSRTLDRLEAKDLIRRVRLKTDRRSITLELTGAGRAVLPKMRACVTGVLNHYLRGIARTEIRHLENTLQRMLANE
jgi:DNA-binding MarR family transcriptional regulator